MYNFVDTTTGQTGSKALPAEAMKYNGVYLEDEIPGYQTLYVSGRELMESEVQEKEITGIDGSVYYGKTYPPRTITVGYQLIAKDNAAFRAAFNKMNQILSAEQVQIIFADETDKYFIGTKVGNEVPDPGINAVVSEFEIYCPDPRKYATTLKEFTVTRNDEGILEATIDNDGSVPACIDYEIINRQDNGYIGIVAESGVMEFGKREEVDGETYKQNETLLHLSDFISAPDDVGGHDAMHPLYGTDGTLTTQTWFGTQFLTLGTPGTIKGDANGGLRTITIPVDSEGAAGCKNFYAYFHLIFYAGLMGQTGEMSISFLTEDDELICGVNWHKGDISGNTGLYDLVVYNPDAKPTDKMAGKVVKMYEYTTSHLQSQNPWYWDWGHCDIKKEGSKIQFFYWGGYPAYNVPEVENMVCKKIQIACKQWGNRGGNQLLTYFGFDVFNFQKLNVEKWRDVPNRYSAGSTVTIDGEYAKIYVNAMPKQEDEIVGTQYFKAPPGESKVRFYMSSWVTQDPTITVRIREAWL